VVLTSNPNKYIQYPAPEEGDVIWESLAYNSRSRSIRTILTNLLTVGLILFYMVPITFISGLSNLSELAKFRALKWLKYINDNDVIAGFIQGYLPGLVLVVFLILLIPLLTALSKQEKQWSKSNLNGSIFSKYFAFHISNVLLGVMFAGTTIGIVDEIKQLTDANRFNLGELIDLLATSLPQRSNFYINYIMIQSLTYYPYILLRPLDLIMAMAKKYLWAKSPRDIREIEKPPYFLYAIYYANDVSIFIIVLTYSSLNPLILPFGIIYFAIGIVALRYMVPSLYFIHYLLIMLC
jgi:hypothetical protein